MVSANDSYPQINDILEIKPLTGKRYRWFYGVWALVIVFSANLGLSTVFLLGFICYRRQKFG